MKQNTCILAQKQPLYPKSFSPDVQLKFSQSIFVRMQIPFELCGGSRIFQKQKFTQKMQKIKNQLYFSGYNYFMLNLNNIGKIWLLKIKHVIYQLPL